MGKKRNLGDVIAGLITALYITPVIKESFHTTFCQFQHPEGICAYSFVLLYVVPAVVTVIFVLSVLQRIGLVGWVIDKLA